MKLLHWVFLFNDGAVVIGGFDIIALGIKSFVTKYDFDHHFHPDNYEDIALAEIVTPERCSNFQKKYSECQFPIPDTLFIIGF